MFSMFKKKVVKTNLEIRVQTYMDSIKNIESLSTHVANIRKGSTILSTLEVFNEDAKDIHTNLEYIVSATSNLTDLEDTQMYIPNTVSVSVDQFFSRSGIRINPEDIFDMYLNAIIKYLDYYLKATHFKQSTHYRVMDLIQSFLNSMETILITTKAEQRSK